MDNFISRSETIKELEQLRASNPHVDARSRSQHNAEITACIHRVNTAPAVDAVPKSYADQIRWERDIAIEQLNEIGCGFGQKMDEVKKKLEASQWIPCSERMPEETAYYLVTIRGFKRPMYAWFMKTEKVWEYLNSNVKIDNVIAWMPLPEQYQEGEKHG